MPFLLVVEAVRQLQQFLEELLDAAAAGVVALDQRLELLGEVGAGAVQLDHPFQLGANRGLEHFEVGVLVLRFLEALPSASKLIFDRSSAGGPDWRISWPVMD
jgi:hypothetical protein